MLYAPPAPKGGDVTVIVPFALAQVGWAVTEALGTEGVLGAALTVNVLTGDVQPALVLAVTLYVPAATAVKTPVVLE